MTQGRSYGYYSAHAAKLAVSVQRDSIKHPVRVVRWEDGKYQYYDADEQAPRNAEVVALKTDAGWQ